MDVNLSTGPCRVWLLPLRAQVSCKLEHLWLEATCRGEREQRRWKNSSGVEQFVVQDMGSGGKVTRKSHFRGQVNEVQRRQSRGQVVLPPLLYKPFVLGQFEHLNEGAGGRLCCVFGDDASEVGLCRILIP